MRASSASVNPLAFAHAMIAGFAANSRTSPLFTVARTPRATSASPVASTRCATAQRVPALSMKNGTSLPGNRSLRGKRPRAAYPRSAAVAATRLPRCSAERRVVSARASSDSAPRKCSRRRSSSLRSEARARWNARETARRVEAEGPWDRIKLGICERSPGTCRVPESTESLRVFDQASRSDGRSEASSIRASTRACASRTAGSSNRSSSIRSSAQHARQLHALDLTLASYE